MLGVRPPASRQLFNSIRYHERTLFRVSQERKVPINMEANIVHIVTKPAVLITWSRADVKALAMHNAIVARCGSKAIRYKNKSAFVLPGDGEIRTSHSEAFSYGYFLCLNIIIENIQTLLRGSRGLICCNPNPMSAE